MLIKNYRESDAVFTISRMKIFIKDEGFPFIGFRNTLNSFIGSTPKRPRIIWIIASGGRLETLSERKMFANLHMLRSRFDSFRRFGDEKAALRLQWIKQNTFIFVHDCETYGSVLGLDHNHFFLETSRWDEQMYNIYGVDVNNKLVSVSVKPDDIHCIGLSDGSIRSMELPAPPEQYKTAMFYIKAAYEGSEKALNLVQDVGFSMFTFDEFLRAY